MKLEWMGQYRELIASLFRFGNAYSQIAKQPTVGDKVRYGPYEVQIMEHILEYGDQNPNMAWYAAKLGVDRSTFSKYGKKLVQKGLVEKYRLSGNKKNIILRLSDLGYEEYRKYIKVAEETWFNEFFTMLQQMPESSIKDIKAVFDQWADWCAVLSEEDKEEKLIKIES